MKRNISLIWSESFDPTDKFETANYVLESTIGDFVKTERIINIELREYQGIARYWIYTEDAV